jgi:hypothetical protein
LDLELSENIQLVANVPPSPLFLLLNVPFRFRNPLVSIVLSVFASLRFCLSILLSVCVCLSLGIVCRCGCTQPDMDDEGFSFTGAEHKRLFEPVLY